MFADVGLAVLSGLARGSERAGGATASAVVARLVAVPYTIAARRLSARAISTAARHAIIIRVTALANYTFSIARSTTINIGLVTARLAVYAAECTIINDTVAVVILEIALLRCGGRSGLTLDPTQKTRELPGIAVPSQTSLTRFTDIGEILIGLVIAVVVQTVALLLLGEDLANALAPAAVVAAALHAGPALAIVIAVAPAAAASASVAPVPFTLACVVRRLGATEARLLVDARRTVGCFVDLSIAVIVVPVIDLFGRDDRVLTYPPHAIEADLLTILAGPAPPRRYRGGIAALFLP
ncbi:hypothetical protein [Sorangium sp. So ce1153]|uniref:hypothetical protein n=1 Tax=Sorangium sp. So ce1153 TaxID=3133333 RepID=UPI003F62A568